MSCCGGNCGCGSACKCGKGCSGCGMYPDLSFSESTPSKTLIVGFAPEKDKQFEGVEVAATAENGGFKCGANCSCDPCTYK